MQKIETGVFFMTKKITIVSLITKEDNLKKHLESIKLQNISKDNLEVILEDIMDEEEITFGNGTSTNNYHFPLSAYYNHSYTQQLFTEEELAAMGITAGSQISAISFNYFCSNTTIFFN